MAFASAPASIMTISEERPAAETGCGLPLAAVVAAAAAAVRRTEQGPNPEVFGFEFFGVMTPPHARVSLNRRASFSVFQSGLSTRFINSWSEFTLGGSSLSGLLKISG